MTKTDKETFSLRLRENEDGSYDLLAEDCSCDLACKHLEDEIEGLAWLIKTLQKITKDPGHRSYKKAYGAGLAIKHLLLYAEAAHREIHFCQIDAKLAEMAANKERPAPEDLN